jgi:hypothetical protein
MIGNSKEAAVKTLAKMIRAQIKNPSRYGVPSDKALDFISGYMKAHDRAKPGKNIITQTTGHQVNRPQDVYPQLRSQYGITPSKGTVYQSQRVTGDPFNKAQNPAGYQVGGQTPQQARPAGTMAYPTLNKVHHRHGVNTETKMQKKQETHEIERADASIQKRVAKLPGLGKGFF